MAKSGLLRPSPYPFKPGMSTHLFAFGKLTEVHLDLLLEYGFDMIEMWGMRPHVDWLDTAQAKRFARHISKIGMTVGTIHLPFYNIFGAPEFRWIAFRNPDPEIRKEAWDLSTMMVDYCADLGCDMVILHGNGTFGPDFDGDDQRFREMLDDFLIYCEKRGVRIAIENIMTKLTSTEKLRKLVDEYDSDYLGLCLDTGHAHIAETVPEAFKNCGARLFTTHIADNYGKKDDHLLPFDGTVDWAPAIASMARHCPNLEHFMFEPMYPVLGDKPGSEPIKKILGNAARAWDRVCVILESIDKNELPER